MRPIHFLFAFFFLVPLIEIYGLIVVGGWLGPLMTVFLVIFTALLGSVLLRQQGLAALQRVQATVARGEVPAIEMMEGVVLLVGGALLLTPGFFTDLLGFACLITPLRRWVIRHLVSRVVMVQPDSPADASRGPTTIEGEWRREDDDQP